MITRDQVLALVAEMPDAQKLSEPEGVTAWKAGRHIFLRLAIPDINPPPSGRQTSPWHPP